ncbi:hypothetical protein C8Q80DRAFT_1109188 [Daedaleopsis nitida]|nr:hypothetical protein C8Q80DRAFT_1109188 [Daedaleopsis nitida]
MEPSPPADSPQSLLDDLTYTIIVRGEEFQLSRSQIAFDSPNYFTDCFSSGFAEARDRILRLDRNPTLFALIVEYLSGYSILPLSPDMLPAGMSVTAAVRWLRQDAEFYDLKRLLSLIVCPLPSVELGWFGLANKVVQLDDVLRSQLPDGVVREPDGSIVSEDTRHAVLVKAQNVLFRCDTS